MKTLPPALAPLAAYKQFINYKLVKNPDGSTDKLPVNPHTGQVASAHDKNIHVHFEQAATTGMPVGFVFTEKDPFFFLDVDHCKNPDGTWNQNATSIYNLFLGCGFEVSQSGDGFHIFGRIPEHLPHGSDCKLIGSQFYKEKRFVALTGNSTTGDANFTPPVETYRNFINSYFPPKIGPQAQDAEWTIEPVPEYTGPEDDQELIKKMLKSKSARGLLGATATVQNLWEADADALGKQFPDDHGNQGRAFDWSLADAALCNHLAFWTGKDCDRIQRIFEMSALSDRTKWAEREPYRISTILGAVAVCKSVYNKPQEIPPPALLFYDELIEKINAEYALIVIGGSAYILRDIIDPITGLPDVVFLTHRAAEIIFANQEVPDPERPHKMINVFKIWLKSPKRREYPNGVVFEPNGQAPSGTLNLYRGLAVKPVKGEWGLFYEFIFTVIADGNEARFKYILAWMARIIQDPGGKRPGVALVLRGGQGTGKGTFANIYGQLFGSHFTPVSQSNQLTGRFNGWCKDKIFVFVDEGYWAGNKAAEGTLKALVTEDNMSVEDKGKDIITVRNHVNLLLASNENWVVPGGRNERRFYVIDISEHRRQNSEYFKQIYDQMKAGGLEAMLYYLKNIDISNINLRQIERTEALLEQILHTINPAQKWWRASLVKPSK